MYLKITGSVLKELRQVAITSPPVTLGDGGCSSIKTGPSPWLPAERTSWKMLKDVCSATATRTLDRLFSYLTRDNECAAPIRHPLAQKEQAKQPYILFVKRS